MDAFRKGVDDNSEFDCMIFVCRQLFQNSFQNSHVEFDKRQANEITCELVRWPHLMLGPTLRMMYFHIFGIF